MNYRSNSVCEYLQELHVTQSFSRAYVPYDNSVVESFFGTMKREELYRTKYRPEQEFKAAVDNYIGFYNTKRPHKKLQYRIPAQWELPNSYPPMFTIALLKISLYYSKLLHIYYRVKLFEMVVRKFNAR